VSVLWLHYSKNFLAKVRKMILQSFLLYKINRLYLSAVLNAKQMEDKKLYRSKEKMLGGVCGGVADFFGIDRSVVRIIFALLILAGTLGFWLYLLMWIIVPQED